MARDNFEAVMEEVFRHEGGLSLDRRDPGNWTGGKVGVGELRGTNFGIAAHAHPGVDIRALTKAQAREIYRRQYWAPVRGDDLRPGLDLVAMDGAVNSGVSRGVRWLQSAVGVAQDGRMGPVTLAAANGAGSPVAVIQRACAARLGFLRGLRTWGSFGRGWSRRVASVEAVAVRMAVDASGAPARPALIAAKDEAEAAAKAARGATAAPVAGGAGLGLADVPPWALALALALLALVVVSQIGRARAQKDRAEAYQRVAEEAVR